MTGSKDATQSTLAKDNKMLRGNISRRSLLGSSAAAGTTALFGSLPLAAQTVVGGPVPRLGRIIIDNDFSGDPDGLFQLAHHLLCTSLDFPLIIGSHLPVEYSGSRSATEAAAKAQKVLDILMLQNLPRVIAGSEQPMPSRAAWKPVTATAEIIHEAMRDNAPGPLVYASGAGLTDLALAWLAEPRIGRRLRLIWIGGREHPGLGGRPPQPDEAEYNFAIDPVAAQVIFNESDIEIWQVPRDAYRQMLFSMAELDAIATEGPIGHFLKTEFGSFFATLAAIPGFRPLPQTDARVLGDSPLVTLTALVGPFEPDAASSPYVVIPTPRLRMDGTYEPASKGRPMRVYRTIDAGLTFRDMISRFRNWQREHATN